MIPAIENKDRKWAVCQLGARMHYAVPRLLHKSGKLERFYTDIYGGQGWPRLLRALPEKWRPAGMQRLLSRVSNELPVGLVKSFPLFGLAYYILRGRARSPEAVSEVFLWAGKSFGERVLRDDFGGADAVYVFNTAGLEILGAAKKRGMFTVVEQTIAPRAVEETLLADGQSRYPGWEPLRQKGGVAEVMAQRERNEWDQADMIVCGSNFVRDGIAQCGGPAERCVVVPYGVDSQFKRTARGVKTGKLRVLTVGEVGLRKGAGCALEVAKALQGIADLRWVGPVSLLDGARAELASQIELTGGVTRNEIMKHYDWADVFFLPSICEGSATVTYEALACGLPVVTTPNAGSTVRDSVNGFIVPIYDVPAMAGRLRELHEDRDLLTRFSNAAAAGSAEVSLFAYQNRFLNLFSRTAN